MELDQQPAFEVHGDDGNAWRIYADGRIDGFPQGRQVVVNRIPILLLLAEQRVREAGVTRKDG